jgi:hypothetical protein
MTFSASTRSPNLGPWSTSCIILLSLVDAMSVLGQNTLQSASSVVPNMDAYPTFFSHFLKFVNLVSTRFECNARMTFLDYVKYTTPLHPFRDKIGCFQFPQMTAPALAND